MRENVEAIYPLSALQHGLLVHHLVSEGRTGEYFEQFSCSLAGEVDLAAFERAWQAVLDRHGVLRTAFVWDGLDRPVQVVHRHLRMPVEVLDWRGHPDRRQRLAALLADDRRRGFELTAAPLTRTVLVRIEEDLWELLWSHHHLLLDGWSASIVLSEVFAVYESLARGRELRLDEPRPFRDYVAWLERRDPAAAEAFWRRHLAGFTRPTELPADREPRAADGAHEDGGRAGLTLDAGTTGRLLELGRRHGLTLGTLVQGAWALLLAAWSGERDVVFGVVTAGRPLDLGGVDAMVGLFVNTVPLRARPGAAAGLLPWLAALQEAGAEARQHDHASLVQVQAWSEVPAGRPLFETIVAFENHPLDRALGRADGPLKVVGTPIVWERTHYAVTLQAYPGDALELRLLYDRQRYRPATAARWLEHLRRLLELMVEAPSRRLGELSPLSAAERHQLVREWNEARPAAGPATCLHELFESRVDEAPDREALAAGGERLTYAELDRRANRLARHLLALGAGSGEPVAICLERSLDLVVSVLGVLKAGGFYVPLDPAYPAERLAWILADTGARLLVTAGDAADGLAGDGRTVVRLDVDAAALAARSATRPLAGVPPASPAYAIHTSGSTGRPKGVLVSHENVARLFSSTAAWFGFGAEDVWTLFHSYAFDFSVWELWGALLHGGRLVVVPFWASREPGELLRLLAAEGVTVLNQTPSAFRPLAEVAAAAPPPAGLALRFVVFGGEALEAAALSPWFERFGDRRPRLVNMYGITETTVHVTYAPLSCEDLERGRIVGVGVPLPDLAVHLLGADGELRPAGAVGEIHVGGAGLAHGYLGRPDLTAERFVPDPWGDGGRLYRSGDLARRRSDGSLEYLGRSDQQIKVRGFRIEPGEVEATLERHPEIGRAVVAVREDGRGDRRLVAWVAARPDAGPDLVAELRALAARRLPDHMVPAAIVRVAAIPLTTNGKVDVAALPAPVEEAPAGAVEAPRDATEERLAALWREVLGLERIGIHDDFFALGGHSLLATRLLSRLREAFEADLGLRTLFASPTVAGVAAAVALERARRAEGGGGQELPPLVPDPERRHEPFPLTDVQQAYWVGRRPDLGLGGVAAHLYLELEGRGIDLDRLERAWGRLVEHHPMLRAVVEADGRQRVLPEVPPYRIARRELAGRPAAEVAAALAEVRREMSHQVLPADRWPLFDVRASRLDGGRTRLHVSLDVLILDGWSLRLLATDLARVYADPGAALEPPAITFRDYVLAEVALRDTDLYRRALEHWRSRLATLPPAPELTLAVRPESLATPRFGRWSHRLAPARWQGLQERARAAGLTASALLLAAFAEVLAAWSKSPRFTLNLTLFNRLPLHPQVDRLLGDFTSLTLLEVDASGTAPFEARARRLQERLWTDLDHRWVGGVQVLRELARARGLGAAAMPVVFTSTLNLGAASAAAGLPAEVVHSITQTPQVWLDHQASELAGELSLVWDAVVDLFPPGLVDAMFAAYRDAVERLVDDEAAWLAPWPCLVPGEQLALYAAAAGPRAPEPEARLEELFAAQAARRPAATAVVAAGRAVSYGELDRRSAHLARALRERGAGPGRLVGVAMEKGWEQVAAVLGVLRAGAAYLPVDPALPPERLRYLLEHGEARVALTQERLRARLDWPPGVEVLAVDAAEPPDEPAPAPAGGPGDLAYVIFTSGSTGLPKGVMIDHRGAVNTILDVNRRFALGPEDRVLGLSGLNFDLSVWDVFGTLAAGGTLVLPEAWAGRDPSHWLELVVREGVTVWNSVPALLEMLVEHAAGRGEALPGSLRLALLSGDWIPVSLPDRFRRLAPAAAVVSLGGATEASIWSILHPIDEVDPAWPSIPYGRAMDNQVVQVLDEALRPRPVWVPGDLYIGGIGVALGYWSDEERTRAAFVTHPQSGERLYKTGDRGRWLPGGDIEFLGREDDQVKVQGHRIELGEVETALIQHPGVQAAVVSARGQHRDRRLVAYVVPAEQRPAPAAPGAPGEEAGEEDLAGSLARLEVKLRQPGLRREPDRPAVPLPGAGWDPDALPGGRLERRSHRRFSPRALPLAALGGLLGGLTQAPAADGGLPHRRYGSAGSLYPVQVYLWVRAGRVEELEGGTYYHDPVEHRLVLLEAGAAFEPEVHFPANRAMVEASAFSLFLVGKMEAIRPVYGEHGTRFALLEAGLITQLLEMTAPGVGIGVCQVGRLDAGRVMARLAPDPDHELLHALVGGPALGAREEPAAAGTPDLAADLERFLRGKLPEALVPRSFVLLRELPLTPNGKVDRRALPEPEAPRPLHGERRPPQSALERRIAAVVQEVLGRSELDVDDSFFELGGTSVHLVQIHGRLREAAGREVPLLEIFNHPSVRALARFLSRGEAAAGEAVDAGEAARRRRLRPRRRQGPETDPGEEER